MRPAIVASPSPQAAREAEKQRTQEDSQDAKDYDFDFEGLRFRRITIFQLAAICVITTIANQISVSYCHGCARQQQNSSTFKPQEAVR